MILCRTLGVAAILVALHGTVCSQQVDEQVANTPGESTPLWLTSYAQAKNEAKANKKLLLLDFTGSDWCGWCIKLKREVFETPEFKDYARRNLVLLEVDFPRRKELDASAKAQNQLLAAEFRVRGFPTIVIMNGEGKVLGALGYTPGGPSRFINALEKLREG